MSRICSGALKYKFDILFILQVCNCAVTQKSVSPVALAKLRLGPTPQINIERYSST